MRADGNAETGLGHVVRSLALAQMLADTFEVSLVCQEIPEQLAQRVRDENLVVKRIASETEFLSLLSSGTIAVLDGYHFDLALQQNIKRTGAMLTCVDDIHDRSFEADLILNHAPGIKAGDYTAKAHTSFALGPDYVLLRPAFLEAAKTERIIQEIDTVFICFGGSDPLNLAERALKEALKFTAVKKVIVVKGAANPHPDAEHTDPRVSYYDNQGEVQMLELMQQAQVAIVPSSGILLEALAAGLPVISGMYADNQKFIYERYKALGCFEDAGDFSASGIANALERSLQKEQHLPHLFDGRSAARLKKIFSALQNEVGLSLRKATEQDAETTYQWAADPQVRAFSFNRNPIVWEEHVAWFSRKVSDANCLYLIFEKNGQPMGSIRFDLKNGEALVSYLLDPEFHGKGYGLKLLVEGIRFLEHEKANYPFQKISGYVFKENLPSLKAFERLGFERTEEGEQVKFEKQL